MGQRRAHLRFAHERGEERGKLHLVADVPRTDRERSRFRHREVPRVGQGAGLVPKKSLETNGGRKTAVFYSVNECGGAFVAASIVCNALPTNCLVY